MGSFNVRNETQDEYHVAVVHVQHGHPRFEGKGWAVLRNASKNFGFGRIETNETFWIFAKTPHGRHMAPKRGDYRVNDGCRANNVTGRYPENTDRNFDFNDQDLVDRVLSNNDFTGFQGELRPCLRLTCKLERREMGTVVLAPGSGDAAGELFLGWEVPIGADTTDGPKINYDLGKVHFPRSSE